jgi:DNA-binding protein HU-beta
MAKKPVKAAKKSAKKVVKPAKKAAKAVKAAPAKAAKATSASASGAKARVATKPRNTSTLSYTQSEFLENVRAFCGLPKRSQAREVIDDIALFVTESLRKGYKIPLMGLGKLYVRESKARMGRNPATGETIHIPKRKKVRFTPAKALKERVL